MLLADELNSSIARCTKSVPEPGLLLQTRTPPADTQQYNIARK
jgi:hypothetical protein